MPGDSIVKADPAVGLINSTQGPNMGSTAMSLTTASESVTASQVQGAPQPQGPLSTAFVIPANALLAEAHSAKHLINITTDGLNLQVPNRKTFFADSASTSVPFLDINNPLSPTFGTQARAIAANSESQNILPSGFTPSKGSAPTLGSGASVPVLAPQISDTQPSIASDSLLSHTTTMPTLSNNDKLPFLTMSGQTVTVDSLGQHSTDIQAPTKSGVSTLSGTTISLAPNESALVVGTSAAIFDPSATAMFGSGSNGTEVQRFNGNALGARDGLWSSSKMLLVSFVLLLWL